MISPSLNTQFHTVSGTAHFSALGLSTLRPNSSSRVLEISAAHIATLEVQQTSAFLDLYNTWYPSSRPSSHSGNQEDAGLNLYLCVPATCFIVMYWGICVVIYFRDRARDEGWHCRVKNRKSKMKQEKHEVPEEEEEGKSNTIEVGADPGSVILLDLPETNTVESTQQSFMSKRKKSFMRREGELKEDEEHASHSQGHRRMLFADGPEFVGLSKELHSVHRIVLEHAQSMERSMMLLRAAQRFKPRCRGRGRGRRWS